MKRKRNEGDNRGYTLDALARKMERNAEADDFRQAHCKKRLAFTGAAIRLDDCLLDENGDERESSLLSDGGRGAEAIRSALDGERGESAAWLCEFRRAVATLGEVEQRVVAALMKDAHPQIAARLAATNRQRVYRTIAKLREVLAKAYEIWKARQCI
jgi:hypothetical protein